MSLFDLASLKLAFGSIARAKFHKSLYALIAFVSWYLFRGLMSFSIDIKQLLYALRPLQYFLIFNFLLVSRSISIVKIWSFITLIFLVGRFIYGTLYFPFAYNWEVAFFYGISIVYLAKISLKKYIFYIFLSSVILMLTDQKSILIAVLFATINRKSLFWILIALVAYLIFFYSDSRMESFFRTFSVNETIQAVKTGFDILESGGKDYHEFVYQDRELLSSSGDLSFHLRLRKWIFALREMNLLYFIFGLGPGYFGGAADSAVLRIFFEVGLFGLILSAKVISDLKLFGRGIGIFLLVSGLLLDTYYSSTCLAIVTILWKTSSSPEAPASSGLT